MEVISPSAHNMKEPTTKFLFSPPTTPPPSTLAHSPDIQNQEKDSLITNASSDSLTSTPPPYPLPPKPRPISVLPEDLKTPDNHVERDARLIRLTGIHPFNVEPPLSALYEEGFLTSRNLHYVRNHGPVPRVEDSEVLDWEFTVEGLVDRPVSMKLRHLIMDYKQVTYPITLVCAGNRRKEQNVVRKTKGFSWGAAGVSTALWTGVALADLLARAGPKRGARYVLLEGADNLPKGSYETSIKLAWAMDPERGVMVAYKMNGELLHPDHGKPLRVVIPGQIGGRSVKWLKRIIVSSTPSENWYHIYDNRVLPTMITPEESANLAETWRDERYAIYDLNTNSAVFCPAHNETVSLMASEEEEEVYKFKGYAYAGGGKRVSRMEVTLDQGRTWMMANITYPEDQYRLAPETETLYGGQLDMSRESCLCWCFWDIGIPLLRLENAKDVLFRAMDEAMMVQPRDMYWSVLGMMNNPWFRLVIHREAGSLRFEHPTQPALMAGGWMERVKKAGGNLANGFWGEKVWGEVEAAKPQGTKEVSMVNSQVERHITLEELGQHDGEDEPWFVVDGQVYDGTKFLEGHPGGAISIISAAGQDATDEFLAIHSENAKAMMPGYHIGTLDSTSLARLKSIGDAQPDASSSSSSSQSSRAVFLQPKFWSKAVLSSKKPISSDSKIFSFTLDHPAQTIGLPVGQHLMMRLRHPDSSTYSQGGGGGGESIIRAYTPISEGSSTGEMHVLVKIYPSSPDGLTNGGKMTQALDRLPLGSAVEFKGPVGKFEYLGRGICTIGGRERRVTKFVMVCAGSGITPIYQVLRAVINDEQDETRCLVIDGNRTEGDILCRDELEDLERRGKDRCKVLYTLSQPSEGWKGARGRMDGKLFEREVGTRGEEGDDTLVLVCGPEGMERGVRKAFEGLGWGEEDLVLF
ncbi:hypothetical protein V8F06_013537 [Rhypophila decipiens]